MKHCYAIVTTCIIVLGLFTMPLDADQGYDRETIVRTMHQVSGFIRQFNNAVNKRDYFIAAESLMEVAKAIKSLEFVMPEKNPKEDWDEIHQALINAAFKGIGVCADKDAETLRSYGEEIRLLMQTGHTLFK